MNDQQFKEELHPRASRGQRTGGQFVSKGGKAETTGAWRATDVAKENSWEATASGLNTAGEREIRESGDEVVRTRTGTGPVGEFIDSLPIYDRYLNQNTVHTFMTTPKGIAGVTINDLHSSKAPLAEIYWLTAVDRGAGRAAMEMLTKAADERGINLQLDAVPLRAMGEGKSLTKAKLEKFYEGFGFHRVGKRSAGYAKMSRLATKQKTAWRATDAKRDEPAADVPEFLYHVTSTDTAAKVKKQGLQRFKTSQWLVAGTGERYGHGEVYAFEDETDAARWAARMDWELNKETGSGKISIVKIKSADNEWTVDESDPISQAGGRGRWLKTETPVVTANVVDVTPLDQARTRALVQELNRTDRAGEDDLGSGDLAETEKIVNATADRLGYDRSGVELSPEMEVFYVGKKPYFSSGKYDNEHDKITIFYNVAPLDEVSHTLAHEIEHAKYRKVMHAYEAEFKSIIKDPEFKAERFNGTKTPAFTAKYPTYTLMQPYNTHLRDELRRTDGVTDYSERYWRDGKNDLKARNETLAEIAAVKMGKKQSREIAPVWQQFYDTIDQAYVQLTKKK